MNERIRDLAVHSGIGKMNQRSDGLYVIGEDVLEKFADSVVKECIKIAESQAYSNGHPDYEYDKGYHNAILDIVAVIEEYFGVK